MMRIGWGQAEITPRGGAISLYGQWDTRITRQVNDPLRAVAIAIATEEGDVVWVGCDLCYISQNMMRAAHDEIRRQRPDFPFAHLIVSATHIHTGPCLDNDRFVARLDGVHDDAGALTTRECMEQVARGVARAALMALSSMRESIVEVGVAREQTGVCRRATYQDGSAQMYGDVHREDFCGMEGRDGGPMQFLYVYDAVRCDLTGVVANIPCPAQCDEHASYVTADYFGVVRSRLQEALGEAVCLLPLVRAAGDLSPHDMVDRVPGIKRCEGRSGALHMGNRVARALLRERERPVSTLKSATRVRHASKDIPFPIWSATEEEYRESKAFLQAHSANNTPGMLYSTHYTRVKRYESGRTHYVAPVHALRMGGVVLLSNPFELYIAYADRIRMRLAQAHVFDVQLACEPLAYLPTPQAVRGGHYSAVNFVCACGPQAGELLVDESVRLVEKLYQGA